MRKRLPGIDSSFVSWQSPFRFRLSLKGSFPGSRNVSIYEGQVESRGVLIDLRRKRRADWSRPFHTNYFPH
jgi:hypothetical protein